MDEMGTFWGAEGGKGGEGSTVLSEDQNVANGGTALARRSTGRKPTPSRKLLGNVVDSDGDGGERERPRAQVKEVKAKSAFARGEERKLKQKKSRNTRVDGRRGVGAAAKFNKPSKSTLELEFHESLREQSLLYGSISFSDNPIIILKTRIVLNMWFLEAVSEKGESKYAPSALSLGRIPPPNAAACPALEEDLREWIQDGNRVPDTIYNFIVMAMALVASGQIKEGDVVRFREASEENVNAKSRNTKGGGGISYPAALKSVSDQIAARMEDDRFKFIDLVCFSATDNGLDKATANMQRAANGVYKTDKGGVFAKAFHPMSWARERELEEMLRVIKESLSLFGRNPSIGGIAVTPKDFYGYTGMSYIYGDLRTLLHGQGLKVKSGSREGMTIMSLQEQAEASHKAQGVKLNKEREALSLPQLSQKEAEREAAKKSGAISGGHNVKEGTWNVVAELKPPTGEDKFFTTASVKYNERRATGALQACIPKEVAARLGIPRRLTVHRMEILKVSVDLGSTEKCAEALKDPSTIKWAMARVVNGDEGFKGMLDVVYDEGKPCVWTGCEGEECEGGHDAWKLTTLSDTHPLPSFLCCACTAKDDMDVA